MTDNTLNNKQNNRTPVRRALLSVSDKTGLVELATALVALDIELISTGGTAEVLRDAGLPVRDVSELTGMEEMMDGRVKTLHPNIHGGLLALRDNAEHINAMEAHLIAPIDLLIVNLYPFEQVRAGGADYDTCVENIDIGGPAMIRAAAKNHEFVTVVVDAEDYADLLAELGADGATSLAFRAHMAQVAFGCTAAYDAGVADWMAGALEIDSPRRIVRAGRFVQGLRYGENPHQLAAFYDDGGFERDGIAGAVLHQGKELSYNNINDINAAVNLVSGFIGTPAAVIIKHTNPCGVALGSGALDAYERAYACDSVSAFGGIVALNTPLNAEIARVLVGRFTECVVAPSVESGALEVLAARPNLRVLAMADMGGPVAGGAVMTAVSGGYLVQTRDVGMVTRADMVVASARVPTADEWRDLEFAWEVVRHVKSNAIVLAGKGAVLGIGCGQTSRVDSVRMALWKAGEGGGVGGGATGGVLASDAFFPFADGLEMALQAGITAVIQPGGSQKDAEVIACADKFGCAMVFTGMRHFRH